MLRGFASSSRALSRPSTQPMHIQSSTQLPPRVFPYTPCVAEDQIEVRVDYREGILSALTKIQAAVDTACAGELGNQGFQRVCVALHHPGLPNGPLMHAKIFAPPTGDSAETQRGNLKSHREGYRVIVAWARNGAEPRRAYAKYDTPNGALRTDGNTVVSYGYPLLDVQDDKVLLHTGDFPSTTTHSHFYTAGLAWVPHVVPVFSGVGPPELFLHAPLPVELSVDAAPQGGYEQTHYYACASTTDSRYFTRSPQPYGVRERKTPKFFGHTDLLALATDGAEAMYDTPGLPGGHRIPDSVLSLVASKYADSRKLLIRIGGHHYRLPALPMRVLALLSYTRLPAATRANLVRALGPDGELPELLATTLEILGFPDPNVPVAAMRDAMKVCLQQGRR